jgi:hypothetical protein
MHCAGNAKSDIIIVSRDSDYGVSSGDRAYLNDHLKQEFSERVSKKEKLSYTQSCQKHSKRFPSL